VYLVVVVLNVDWRGRTGTHERAPSAKERSWLSVKKQQERFISHTLEEDVPTQFTTHAESFVVEHPRRMWNFVATCCGLWKWRQRLPVPWVVSSGQRYCGHQRSGGGKDV